MLIKFSNERNLIITDLKCTPKHGKCLVDSACAYVKWNVYKEVFLGKFNMTGWEKGMKLVVGMKKPGQVRKVYQQIEDLDSLQAPFANIREDGVSILSFAGIRSHFMFEIDARSLKLRSLPEQFEIKVKKKLSSDDVKDPWSTVKVNLERELFYKKNSKIMSQKYDYFE